MADMQAGIGPFLGVAAEPRLGHRRHRDGHRAGRYRRHDRHRARRGVHDATTRQRGCVIVAGVFTVVTIAATDESLRLLDDYAELVAQYRG